MKVVIVLLVTLAPAAYTTAAAQTLLVANKSSLSVSFIDEATLSPITELIVGATAEDTPHEVGVNPTGEYALVTHYGRVAFNGKNCAFDNHKNPGSLITILSVPRAHIIGRIQLPAGASPHGIYFLDEQRALVTAEGMQSLLIVDVHEQAVVQSYPLPGAGAHMVVADGERHFAYIANKESGTVVKFDLAAGEAVKHQKIGREAEGIALTNDGQELYVTNRVDHTLSFLDTSNLEVTHVLGTGRGPIRVALFDNDTHAVVANTLQGTAETVDLSRGETDGTFVTTHTYSSATGKFFQSIFGLLKVPITIVVRPDQRTAYVANSFAGNISLVDLQDHTVLDTFAAGKEPDGMARSPLAVNDAVQSRGALDGEAAAYLQAQENTLCVEHDGAGRCVDADGFSRDSVLTAYAVVDAPMNDVWNVLMDIDKYPTWNTFMPSIVSTLQVGAPLRFQVNLENWFPQHETVYVQRRQDPSEFCWGSSPLGRLMTTQRCKHLQPLADGRTVYYTTEKFKGSVGQQIGRFFAERIQDGIDLEAVELKNRVESLTHRTAE